MLRPVVTARHCQRGAILPLTLVFSLLLALLAASAVQTAGLQFQLSANDQWYEQALHQADAIAGELAQQSAAFDLSHAVADSNCLPGSTRPSCTAYTLPTPQTAALAAGVELAVAVRRIHPAARSLLRATAPPGSTPGNFASFEVDVDVDGRAVDRGHARVVYGVIIPLSGGAPVTVSWREADVDPL